jgi:uncharacterized protein YgiM (DUF1202 family)
MRSAFVFAPCLFVCSLVLAAEQEFPYTAYIAGNEVVVRSGPARRFYATDRMRGGEEVEVYRHENGWCAIRPPESSFSWVKADELRIGTDGVALVTVDKASCRVGSNVGELRDVTQVKLDRGEEVEVLDAVRLGDGDAVEFWCKIAPPSGEFRWVHEDEIAREPPTPAEDRGEGGPQTARWGSWVRSRRTDADERNAATESPADGYRPKFSARGSSGEIALAGGVRDASAKTGDSSTRGNTDSEAGSESLTGLAKELDAINLDLTKVVIDEPARWQLDEVRRRADGAFAQATTALERGKARLLLSRIESFEDIRRRSLGLPSSTSAPPASTPAVTNLQSASAITLGVGPLTASTLPTDAGRFDGVGKLTRVVSQRPNAPQYALVNPQNDVVAFVSPAPGVNLQTFEGQYVGVTGQRGYMPELKKSHLTALRVAPVQIGTTNSVRRR